MKKLLFTLLGATMFAVSLFGMASCVKEDDDLEVVAPDGAPALALLNAIEKEEEGEAFDFKVVDANTISAYVTGTSPEADFCVLPVNLASKLLGEGTVYEMLGTVTHGNLYFLSTNESELLTKDDLASLIGKKVGVVQLPNVPGLTLKAVLHACNVPFTQIESAQAEGEKTKVNLVPFTPENVTLSGGCDYYLCPEPAASTKIKGTMSAPKPFKMAGDLQALYGEGGYPQAVAVAKKSVIESRKEAVETFISYLEGSAAYLAGVAPATVLDLLNDVRTEGLTPSFNANNLTAQVIANCSVSYVPSKTCKQEVKDFLQELISIDEQSAALPEDAFFYMN